MGDSNKTEGSLETGMRLIVGLGNPGKGYRETRHNLGFLVLEELAKTLDVDLNLSSFTKALIAESHTDENKICLFLPMMYMNRSGVAVKHVVEKKGIDLSHVLVICDDLNLDFGKIRIRSKGSDGGHNGLGSIIECLGTEEFARLRMGIGSAPDGQDASDYVLEEFGKEEKKSLSDFVTAAKECSLAWLNWGVDKAMEQFNGRSS